MTSGFRLGVDFGTSSTVGMLEGPDSRTRPLLFDASPLLPSAVFASGDSRAELLTGADAVRAAVGDPGRLEAHPKRAIDDGTVLLGLHDFAVVDLIAGVLARVAVEAERVAGESPREVTLGHPVNWAATRLAMLADAAARVGWHEVRFVAEPVAAAAAFLATRTTELQTQKCLLVYDLGAGTFDVAVLRRRSDGFAVLANSGLADLGGIDFDAAIIAHLRAGSPSAAWDRLQCPTTSADRRARQALWSGVRAAKEQLSRHPMADVHLPGLDTDVHLTRTEFDSIALPLLERTAAQTLDMLRGAGISVHEIGAAFLVGGGSRIPLAATVLHRALGLAPTIVDQPELTVAEGCLLASSTMTSALPSPSGAGHPTTAPDSSRENLHPAEPAEPTDAADRPAQIGSPGQPAGPRRTGRRIAAVLAAATALIAGAARLSWPDTNQTDRSAAAPPSTSSPHTDTTTPAPPTTAASSPTPEEVLVLTGHFDSSNEVYCTAFVTDGGLTYAVEWEGSGGPPTGRVTVHASRTRRTPGPHTAALTQQLARFRPLTYKICIDDPAELYIYEAVRQPG